MSRWARWAGLAGAVLLLLTACAASGNPDVVTGNNPPGFWLGLWHGLISPVTVIISLFRDDVGIYEVANSGAWYDIAFMIGVSIFFSGSARSGSASRRRGRASSRGGGR